MSEAIQAILILIGGCFSAMMIGGSFVLGIALVCRHLKWAPVNIIVNVNNNIHDSKRLIDGVREIQEYLEADEPRVGDATFACEALLASVGGAGQSSPK